MGVGSSEVRTLLLPIVRTKGPPATLLTYIATTLAVARLGGGSGLRQRAGTGKPPGTAHPRRACGCPDCQFRGSMSGSTERPRGWHMPQHQEIVVYGTVPLLTAGLVSILHQSNLRARAGVWASTGSAEPVSSSVAVVVDSDRGWPRVRAVLNRPHQTVIVFLHREEEKLYRRAFQMGAKGVGCWKSSQHEISSVVNSALRGRALLPSGVAQELVLNSGQDSPLTDQEELWLSKMAGGATTRQLARESDMSERSIYRALGRLYQKLNVASRLEAVSHYMTEHPK